MDQDKTPEQSNSGSEQINDDWKYKSQELPQRKRGSRPEYLEEVNEKEAYEKWGEKIYTYTGKTKKETDTYKDILLEELQQESIKGKINYFTKQKKQDKLEMKSKENSYKDDKSDLKDIPIDGDFIEGSTVYMRNCSGCHSLESNTQARKTTGPALGLIYGKRAGSDQHYSEYTDSLLDSKLIWNSKSLFPFLKNSKGYLKGIRCDSYIESEEERADITQFLKLYAKNLAKNLRVRADKVYGKSYTSIQLQTDKLIDDEVKRKQKELP